MRKLGLFIILATISSGCVSRAKYKKSLRSVYENGFKAGQHDMKHKARPVLHRAARALENCKTEYDALREGK